MPVTMLLIDHDQRELVEADALAQKRMRTQDEVDLARGDVSAAAAACIRNRSASDRPITPSDPIPSAARLDMRPQSIARNGRRSNTA